jgi:hypothetical protein
MNTEPANFPIRSAISGDGPLLVGNSFPFPLIRRRVVIEPLSDGEARDLLMGRGFVSFWGHGNTLHAAREFLGVDLAPRTSRPALTLDEANIPSLDGMSSSDVLVISPEYAPGYRPEIGQEVPIEKILGFQALLITFL